jgi:hypothetical protein
MGRERIHGQVLHSLDKKFMDKEQSCQWLKFRGIRGETESMVVVAYDHAVSTNCFKKRILKEEIESKCQLCEEY